MNQQKPSHNTNFLFFHLKKNSTESGHHSSPLRVIGLLLQACRPLNMLMGALMVLLSCGFATSWQLEVFQGVLVCVSVGFLIGAQMLLNDVYDRKIDKEQKPWRPLASGQIHLRTAVLFSIFLTTFSCVLAAFVSISCFIYVLILGCLCFFYSSYLKKQWGVLANVLSSGLTASLCFSGLVLGGRIVEMLSISLSVVCACMAREIAKDVEDLSGDRLFRQRTLPMLLSEKTVRNIVCLFVGLQILFSYLPLTLGTFGNFYFLLISVCNILFVASIVPILRGTDQGAARQAQQIVKIFMVAYLCIFFIC